LITLRKLAEIVGGKVIGAPDKIIVGASDIKKGAPNTITFIFNLKHKDLIRSTKASAVIVPDKMLLGKKDGIVVKNPRLAMAQVLGFFENNNLPKSIHKSAIIPNSVKIGKGLSVGAHTVIGEHSTIADDVIIHSNVSIGSNVTIGSGTEILPQVAIYDNVKIGNNVLIDSGTAVGSKGYGYETVDDVHHTIPQIGTVVIEDGVALGSNCTIDRGTINDTIIGKGTKIDNMVHIAHNVKVGKGCLIAGQTGIAGSATVGDYCIFGGQVGVKDGITIGDRAIFVAKTGVSKSVTGGKIYAGMPCREIMETNKRDAAYTQIQSLKKRLKILENKLEK